MPQISLKELRIAARTLDRENMTKWLQEATGKAKITAAEFNEIMRQHLPKESQYQAEVMRFIATNYPDGFVWKVAAGPYCRQGIPDVCAIIDGHFFAFEIKRPFIGKLSKLQELTIANINNAGGTAAVISFDYQAKAVIESVLG